MSNQPPIEVPQGAIRLNTDSQKLEFFAQDRWFEMATDVPTLDGGARGTFTGGEPSISDNMEFITIPTRGNGTDFGDYIINNATGNKKYNYQVEREDFVGGGESPSAGDSHNTIGKHEFASSGSAIDFANLDFTSKGGVGMSNSTRAVQARGYGAPSLNNNDICYWTMASQQDAVDFGNLTSGSSYGGSAVASSTRGVIAPSRSSDGSFVKYN